MIDEATERGSRDYGDEPDLQEQQERLARIEKKVARQRRGQKSAVASGNKDVRNQFGIGS
jgi:hypothetical protein